MCFPPPPESALDHGLLVLRILCVSLGQVDESPLAGIALVSIEEDVGTPDNHPTTLPDLALLKIKGKVTNKQRSKVAYVQIYLVKDVEEAPL